MRYAPTAEFSSVGEGENAATHIRTVHNVISISRTSHKTRKKIPYVIEIWWYRVDPAAKVQIHREVNFILILVIV